jgi:hypothetical protein
MGMYRQDLGNALGREAPSFDRVSSADGVGNAVAAAAAQLEIVERVAAAVVEGDAMVDFESIGAAALDAHTVACVNLGAGCAPVPACSDLASVVPARSAVAAVSGASVAAEAVSG